MHSHQYFDYINPDQTVSINKVRIIGNTITLYFNEADFDTIPNISHKNYGMFGDKDDYHTIVHINDHDKYTAHIHLIKLEIITITLDDLLSLMHKLLEEDKNIMRNVDRVGYMFKIKSTVDSSFVTNIAKAYNNFLYNISTFDKNNDMSDASKENIARCESSNDRYFNAR